MSKISDESTLHELMDIIKKNFSDYQPRELDNSITISGVAVSEVEDVLNALNGVIPSGASSSNKLATASDIPTTLPASDVSAWAKAPTKPAYNASEVGAIATTAKGATNGVASLGSNGKVPSRQLPHLMDMNSATVTIPAGSGWIQPSGASYYYYDVQGVFDKEPAGDFFIAPGGTAPGEKYPDNDAASFDLLYDARTRINSTDGSILVRLYASAQPQHGFTVRFITFV